MARYAQRDTNFTKPFTIENDEFRWRARGHSFSKTHSPNFRRKRHAAPKLPGGQFPTCSGDFTTESILFQKRTPRIFVKNGMPPRSCRAGNSQNVPDISRHRAFFLKNALPKFSSKTACRPEVAGRAIPKMFRTSHDREHSFSKTHLPNFRQNGKLLFFGCFRPLHPTLAG